MKKFIKGFVIAVVAIVAILMVIGYMTGPDKKAESKEPKTSQKVSSESTKQKESSKQESSTTKESSTSVSSTTVESTTVESTKQSAKPAKSKEQTLLDSNFQSLNDGSYPYALDAKVKKDGKDIDYVQLDVSGDWSTLSAEEKENYINLLKTLSADFMDSDGQMPFMQVSSANKIVAHSSALDTNKVKILE